ncbi:magnesium transporter [candidate division KSB1 bacterium]|nr:magnesium transporter [candidate division KSB1 bacterium]
MTEEIKKEHIKVIQGLIAEGKSLEVRTRLKDMHPADVADLLENLNEADRNYVFRLLDKEQASEVVLELEEVHRDRLLDQLDPKQISRLVDGMESDDAADIVAELEAGVADQVLAAIGRRAREEVQALLGFAEETAGAIMAKEMVAVKRDSTQAQAIQEIRRQAQEMEEVYYVFVVDDEQKLVGIVSLKDLIIAEPQQRVGDLMNPDVIYAQVDQDQEEVAHLVRKYDLASVPVVDNGGRLVGRITVDDIVDVIDEEAAEDISLMAGTEEDHRETSVFRITRQRLPWLVVGLLGGIIAALVMSRFELSLEKVLALAFFVPVVTAMGGNIGVQSSSIVVRGLAAGEIGLSGMKGRLFREIRVALINGLLLGTLIFIIIDLWLGRYDIGLAVGTALVVNILIASLLGSNVPILLKKLNIDPALAMGPFVTTANDIIGLFIYLGIATLFLIH